MILDEIVSIKKIGSKTTIDIEVDGDHLFYCNGILTHNSAAGDVSDVTEESIQGGISKIQSADNVLAFIPSSGARDVGILKAKWLKSRDSGAVGKYITFQIDWSTLSFDPIENPDAQGHSNNPTIHIKSPQVVTSPDGTESMAPSKKGTSGKVTGSNLRGKSSKKTFKKSSAASNAPDTEDEEPREPKKPASLAALGNSLKTSNKNPKLF
ncbi:MAG: hypothetical protein DRH57_09195 [Candidatus Cloacimonadota bacterium]|nr:MAG: hypothetical protein DRH57_09195 [Candidatus Cloacimonadota bacterium]